MALPFAARAQRVNDVHSGLNPSQVARIVTPASGREIQAAIAAAAREKLAVSIAGGRHAMGGQQFGEGTVLLDMTGLDRVRSFDARRGIVEVEAGITWPPLIEYLLRAKSAWGIAQKQTGANRLTIGGAMSANAHGRGLKMKPFNAYVESFSLINAEGQRLICSRQENAELFRLVHGGYGLFGVVESAALRLVERVKLERVVEVTDVERFVVAVEKRAAEGFLYGDFQYAIDPASDDFLYKGVFACYRPVAASTPVPARQQELSDEQWINLIYLAHAHKQRAFD
ncbi:MAG: FAD-binding oxidoreductase, partial [Bryobacteraceae bacterium]